MDSNGTSTKQDALHQSEIPIVAAVPMIQAEQDDYIRVYPCSVVQNEGNNESQPESTSNPSGSTTSTLPSAATSSEDTSGTSSQVTSSMLTASTTPSTTTARSNSALEEADETAQTQEEQTTQLQPTTPTRDITVIATPEPVPLHHSQEPPLRTTSSPPAISAIATPEPVRLQERAASSPPETTTAISVIATPEPTRHHSDPPITATPQSVPPQDPLQQQQQSTALAISPIQQPQQSTALTITPVPQPQQSTTLAITPVAPQQQLAREESAPLQMDQLTSPAPLEVVTDERHNVEEPVYGKWRTSLFACFTLDAWCTALPWMSCCCGSIVMGQLMTRLRLNWLGSPDHERYHRTFGILVAITFVWFALAALGVGSFAWPFLCLFVLILGTRVRTRMRKHYGIKAKYCVPGKRAMSCWEDFCCMLWCPCCATMQMAQQTHDENEYPYECFSPTGLPPHAPEIIVV